MRLLLDSCVWGPAATELRGQGHDVIWAGDWERDPGNREILRRAHTEQRKLVTLDKDLGELAVIQNQPHSGIVRLVGFSARKQASACQEVSTSMPTSYRPVRWSRPIRRGCGSGRGNRQTERKSGRAMPTGPPPRPQPLGAIVTTPKV